MSKDKDYAFLTHDQVPALDALKHHCEAMFERQKETVLAATKAPHSLFSYNKTPDGPEVVQVDEMRPIVDFLCHPDLVSMAVDYIGEMPVLGNICLWYSRTGSERLGPQNIHRDMNCKRQLHVVIPIRPIDQGTGPFTFWPGDKSCEVIEKINHFYGRFEDDEFFNLAGRDQMIPFTSERGAALAINPYACFHFGGRAETTPRFVLICSYTSRFENAEEGLGTYRLVNRGRFSDGSSLRRKLLNL